MAAAVTKRSPEAVQELEAMQQQERTGAGEQMLVMEDFERLLREDIQREVISARLQQGGLEAAIEAAGTEHAVVEERYQARLNAWRVDDPSQWSRYETPAARSQIARTCTRIETVFANHSLRLKELPVVGTLTTGQVTARTQKSSAGTPMILIDNGFFKFAGMMSQLAMFATYDAQVRGGFTEGTVQLVSDLAATQTVLNTCLYAHPRSTPPDFRDQVESLQDAVCLFVISHEYAHLAAGDLDAHPSTGKGPDDGLREKEFAADKIGFKTVMETAQDAEAGAFAAFLFLAGLDLLARAAAAYKGQPDPPATSPPGGYPTPYERTANLLNWLETSSYVPDFLPQIRGASACYNTVLSVWDEILVPFWAAREQLSQFDPALHGPSHYPEADAQGVVTILWLHVQAHLGWA